MRFDTPPPCDQGQPWCRLIEAMLRGGDVGFHRLENGGYEVRWAGKIGTGQTIFEAIDQVFGQVYDMTSGEVTR